MFDKPLPPIIDADEDGIPNVGAPSIAVMQRRASAMQLATDIRVEFGRIAARLGVLYPESGWKDDLFEMAARLQDALTVAAHPDVGKLTEAGTKAKRARLRAEKAAAEKAAADAEGDADA